jgi:hypothetical protein
VGERVGEISDQGSDFRSGGIFNRQRDLAQSRVAKLEDGAKRHICIEEAGSAQFEFNCLVQKRF